MKFSRRRFLKNTALNLSTVIVMTGCTGSSEPVANSAENDQENGDIDARIFPTNIDSTIIAADSTTPIDSETTTLVNL